MMTTQKEFTLPAMSKGFHLITDLIIRELKELPQNGLLNIFLKHTSAALILNENFDPDVREDFEHFMNHLVPENYPGFTHTSEGSDDMPAHIKSSIFSQSVTLPLTGGKPNLGTWQGIYLCEFRRYASGRRIILTVIS